MTAVDLTVRFAPTIRSGSFRRCLKGNQPNRSSGHFQLPIEEKLKHHIIDGERIGLEDSLKAALKKYPPLEIITTFCLTA
jgi:cobalamin-dependent methionine synthase I